MKLNDRALGHLLDWVARPQSGDVVGERFELRQRIGEGGMSVVYAAHDRRGGAEVAVKILTEGSDNLQARLEREVEALQKVTHPALVELIAHGVHEGTCFLVMERLHGCNLAERLRLGRLSVRNVVDLGIRIASALAQMHRLGIVHRDIKPANVFLRGDLDGSRTTGACLLDFGLARAEGATTLTATGVLLGTPGYIAPERVRGDAASTEPAGDLFSLGCVLYECLLGRPPFQAETTHALLARVLVEMAPALRNERPDAPHALVVLVERMLAKDPAARPTASEVESTCRTIGETLPEGERLELAPGIAEGDVIGGKYRVERRLGAGGMGVVVAARHLELGTDVAIKVVRAGDTDEARLLREARAASRLESEHVARVLDVGRAEDGRPFIVMEHLRGEDLARRLATAGRFASDVAASYLLQACDAVAEAHALGIVHRDLKPSNLFLATRRNGSETIKVLDFGISKLTRPLGEASMTHTADAVVMGSIAYMAPEQLESSARADARSDIWSLGIVLFELVTGEKPFIGESAVAVAARIAASPPRSLRALAPDVSPAIESLIARCLSKEPSARFEDIAALVVGLTSPPALAKPPATKSKRLWLAAGIGLGAVAAVAVAKSSASPPLAAPAVPASVVAMAPFVAPPSSAPVTAAIPPSEPAPAPSTSTKPAAPSTAPPRTAAASARPTAPASAKPAPSAGRRDLDLRDPALEGR